MKVQRAGIGFLVVAVLVLLAILTSTLGAGAEPEAPYGHNGGNQPTPLPEDRGWFSAVPLDGPFASPLPAPQTAAHAAAVTYMPEVFDLQGLARDWDWLHSHFGNMAYVPTQLTPRFVLRAVFTTIGPATIVVRVVDVHGYPMFNQPVFLSWPGISCAQPDPNIRPIDPGYRTRLRDCGILQRTDSNGYTGFGMSGDWYYRSGQAPGEIWIGSPGTASDGTTGIGMLGGTNHECPCSLVFQEVINVEPTVTPSPTPGPVPTTTPMPTATPDPRLTLIDAHLVEIRDVLQAILDRLLQGKVLYIPAVQQ